MERIALIVKLVPTSVTPASLFHLVKYRRQEKTREGLTNTGSSCDMNFVMGLRARGRTRLSETASAEGWSLPPL
jgi:hypothetical protein